MIITLLALVLLYSMAALVFMIMDNRPKFHMLFDQWQHKELIRHNVYQCRLSNMVRYLGIDMESYIMKLPEREIRHHIMRCKTCPNIPACDRCLRDGEVTNNLDFCPNYSSLLGFSRTLV
jgi:hypothetical protein